MYSHFKELVDFFSIFYPLTLALIVVSSLNCFTTNSANFITPLGGFRSNAEKSNTSILLFSSRAPEHASSVFVYIFFFQIRGTTLPRLPLKVKRSRNSDFDAWQLF